MKKFFDRLIGKIVDLFRHETTYYVILIIYCILFTLSVNKMLMPFYYVGAAAVAQYEKSFSIIRMLFSVTSVLTMAYMTNKLFNRNDCASLIMKILFIIYTTPMLMSFSVTRHTESNSFFILFIIYWVLTCVVAHFILYNMRVTIRGNTGWTRKSFRVLYIIVVALLVGYMVASQSDFHIATELISGTYQQRAAYKASIPGVWAYIKMACGGFICPALIAYYLKRNLKLSLFFIFLQVLLFSLARDKAYFFLILISIIIGLMADKIEGNYNKMSSIITTGYLLACLLPLIGVGSLIFFEIIVRREIFMPSWLNYLYYEYFTTHSPIWWRQDTFLIDKLFDPPYLVTISKLIDQEYFQSMVGNPNAGMFAEAISRCGYLGIIIYPFIFGFVLKWVNHFSKKSVAEIKIMYAFCMCLLVQNDTITSTGFVIALVMMSLLTLIFGDIHQENLNSVSYSGIMREDL